MCLDTLSCLRRGSLTESMSFTVCRQRALIQVHRITESFTNDSVQMIQILSSFSHLNDGLIHDITGSEMRRTFCY